MKNHWVRQNNDYYLAEVSQETATMPVGVYKINQNPKTAQLYCSGIQDAFTFPYKVYGIETKLIQRVVKTYGNTNKNLGVLLNGIKGTGKTVTAQMICNELKLPVLIVHQAFPAISSFLNEIQQDVIVFFDEYEKMYNRDNDNETEILTIMDGVLNTGYRKVFMLTTNSLYLNDNLLQRPGRLRYIKAFNDLTLDVITEIVDDKLIHKELRDKCIEFIARLETITIDIVQAVVEEVNIHEEAPDAFKDVFNIQTITNKVNLFTADSQGHFFQLAYSNIIIDPVKFTKENEEDEFYVNGRDIGMIKEVISDEKVTVELYGQKREVVTYRIERLDTVHKSFTNKFTC